MRSVLVLACAAGVLGLCSAPASAELLTFENIQTTCCDPVSVPNSYAGLTWSSDWHVLDGRDFTQSGYQNGTISGRNVLTAPGGDMRMITSDRPFTLTSLYATAAWSDDLELLIYAFRDGVAISSYGHPIDVATPLRVDLSSPPLGFDGIDGVGFFVFGLSGGTPHVWPDGHTTSGEQFVIDDLQFSFDKPAHIPEPMSGALLLTGLAAMAIVRRHSANGR